MSLQICRENYQFYNTFSCFGLQQSIKELSILESIKSKDIMMNIVKELTLGIGLCPLYVIKLYKLLKFLKQSYLSEMIGSGCSSQDIFLDKDLKLLFLQCQPLYVYDSSILASVYFCSNWEMIELFYINYLNLIQMSQPLRKIIALFPHATETTKRFLGDLIRDAVKAFGEAAFTDLMSQWLQLSKKLNSPSKLNCLHDKNHRLLIIQFMKEEAIKNYSCSYFNSAMIHPGYIDYIHKLRPELFKEIVMIASRLKLVQKRFKEKMEHNHWIEDHIDAQIRVILTRFNTNKRKINNNFEKFKAIADFDDLFPLVIQMGKLVRMSWSNEKKNKNEEARIASERSLTQVMEPNEESHTNLFEFELERNAQIIIDGFFA